MAAVLVLSYAVVEGMISAPFPFVFVTMAQHYLALVRTLAQDCHTGCLDTICSPPHLALLFCSTFSLHWGRNGDTEVSVVAHTCHPVVWRQRLHSELQASLHCL